MAKKKKSRAVPAVWSKYDVSLEVFSADGELLDDWLMVAIVAKSALDAINYTHTQALNAHDGRGVYTELVSVTRTATGIPVVTGDE